MRLFSYDNRGRAAIGAVRSAAATEFVDLGATRFSFSTDMTGLLAEPGGLAAAKAAPSHALKPLAGVRNRNTGASSHVNPHPPKRERGFPPSPPQTGWRAGVMGPFVAKPSGDCEMLINQPANRPEPFAVCATVQNYQRRETKIENLISSVNP